MRKLRFEVILTIADDDQTDSEAGKDVLEHVLTRGFKQMEDETGCEPWPLELTVLHIGGE